MHNPLLIAITLAAPGEQQRLQEEIHAGLPAFNSRFVGPSNYSPFAMAARDSDGKLLGGVSGDTAWEWLHIHLLWVDEHYRGQGIGRNLLRAAESLGRERGCRNAYLNTYDFQARPFYEREGYTVYGVQDDYPPGRQRFLMRKQL